MFAGIGIVVLLAMVFGGFIITGGAIGPVAEAIPHEMLIIGGAAIGALITGNSMHELKGIGGGLAKVFKGPRHTKQDHIDAIVLCAKLMKILRSDGPVALESRDGQQQGGERKEDIGQLQAPIGRCDRDPLGAVEDVVSRDERDQGGDDGLT